MLDPDEIRRVRAIFREEASALCPASEHCAEARRKFDRAAWLVAVLTWVLEGQIESPAVADVAGDLEIVVPNDLAVMRSLIAVVENKCRARRAANN